MNKEKKNKLKKIFSMTTVVIIVLSLCLVILNINTPVVKAAPTGYNYYKQITISNTFVEATLTNFPILIHDNTGDLAGKILPTGNDISFWDSTNTTQFKHEIEFASNATGEVIAWVNVTSISSSGNTIIYMFYGKFSATNQQDIENTWDSNYVLVHHMTGTAYTALDDSTVNNNDVAAVYGDPDYNQTGKISGAVNLASASSEALNISDANSLDYTQGTLEMWIKPTTITSATIPMAKMDLGRNQRSYALELGNGNGKLYYTGSTTGTNYLGSNEAAAVAAGSWFYIQGYSITSKPYSRINTTIESTVGADPIASFYNSNTPLTIGCRLNSWAVSNPFNGLVDEVRISNIVRSYAWLNASFNSENQTTGFVTIGSETSAEQASVYQIKGLAHGIIDWNGTVGTTAWSNSSGYYNEVMEINMSVNNSDNVSEVRVWVGNQNDSGQYINASNISLFISGNNATWGTLGYFTDGGSNLSINSTTWNAGTMGTSPFGGTGYITNRNESIYCVFLLDIPSTITAQDYFSATTTSSSEGKNLRRNDPEYHPTTGCLTLRKTFFDFIVLQFVRQNVRHIYTV